MNLLHSRTVEVKYDWEPGGLSSFDSVVPIRNVQFVVLRLFVQRHANYNVNKETSTGSFPDDDAIRNMQAVTTDLSVQVYRPLGILEAMPWMKKAT